MTGCRGWPKIRRGGGVFDKRNRPGLDEAVVTGDSTKQWRAEEEIEQDAGEGGV